MKSTGWECRTRRVSINMALSNFGKSLLTPSKKARFAHQRCLTRVFNAKRRRFGVM